MLKLIKRFTNKNLKGSCETIVSTSTMTNEEYIAAIEGGILPHWADRELMEKTGIQDLFTENVKVKNEMSYEDVCDCLKRVYRMIDMSAYVGAEFADRSKELDESNDAAFKQHLTDMSTGKTSDMFVVKNDFYSADTIRDLFIEAQDKAEISAVSIPEDAKEAMKTLENSIKSLRSIKDLVFMNAIVFAHVANAEMVGFKQ